MACPLETSGTTIGWTTKSTGTGHGAQTPYAFAQRLGQQLPLRLAWALPAIDQTLTGFRITRMYNETRFRA
eukprot:885906-Amphidinium_carterae.1